MLGKLFIKFIERKIAKWEKENDAKSLLHVKKLFSDPQQLFGRWVKIWTLSYEPFIIGKVIKIEWSDEKATLVLQKYDGFDKRGKEERLSNVIIRFSQADIKTMQPYTVISDELCETLIDMLNEFMSSQYKGKPKGEKPTGISCPRCGTEIIVWEWNTQWGYKCQTEDCLSNTLYGY